MNHYYRLIAEFATEEQANIAHDILESHFHCDELLWNQVKEIPAKSL